MQGRIRQSRWSSSGSRFAISGGLSRCFAREDGTVIAGHGRLQAALAEKIKEAPVIVARGWTEAQCRAYALVDNKIGLNSGWDDEILGVELSELRDLGMDIAGFDDVPELEADEPEEKANGKQRSTELNPIIQFNIVFDDEQQQEVWFAFVRSLKTKYPDAETLGARLAKHLEEAPASAAA